VDNVLYEGNGHLYQSPLILFTYTEALAYAANMPKCCGGQTAHLATITSELENSFIVDNVIPIDHILIAGYTFIGLNDQDNNGQYKWVTKETVSFRQNLVKDYDPGYCAVIIIGITDWAYGICGAYENRRVRVRLSIRLTHPSLEACQESRRQNRFDCLLLLPMLSCTLGLALGS